jgi:hypothetical protein
VELELGTVRFPDEVTGTPPAEEAGPDEVIGTPTK